MFQSVLLASWFVADCFDRPIISSSCIFLDGDPCLMHVALLAIVLVCCVPSELVPSFVCWFVGRVLGWFAGKRIGSLVGSGFCLVVA